MPLLQAEQTERHADVAVAILRGSGSAETDSRTPCRSSAASLSCRRCRSTATSGAVQRLRLQAASSHIDFCASSTSSDQRPAHGSTRRPDTTTPAAPRTNASSAKCAPLNRVPMSPQKTSSGFDFAAVDDDRPDERRIAVARRHRSHAELAAEQFVKIGEGKLHDGIGIAGRRRGDERIDGKNDGFARSSVSSVHFVRLICRLRFRAFPTASPKGQAHFSALTSFCNPCRKWPKNEPDS